MTTDMEIYPESSKLLDSLRADFKRASVDLPALEIDTLTDLAAERHRDSGVWEFLSIICGTGGAATVAVRTIGTWIASTVTKIRIKVGDDEFVIEARNAEAVLPRVADALAALRHSEAGTHAVTDEAVDGE
ncbi:effector-associated constant component EACC1 [Streptomyces violascens]|uniref:effector-associated constant component EACC1 n=1 Tax=Streptomyces violascens TaxID=67381 RepID=UPI003696BDC3